MGEQKSKSRGERISNFLFNDNLWAMIAMMCLGACYKFESRDPFLARAIAISIISLEALYIVVCEVRKLVARHRKSGSTSLVNFENAFWLLYLAAIVFLMVYVCTNFYSKGNSLTIRCMAAAGIFHILHEAHKLIYYSEKENWGYRIAPHLISAVIIGTLFIIYISGGKCYLSYAYIASSGILSICSLILGDVVQNIHKGGSGTLPTVLAVILIIAAIFGTLRPEFYGLVEVDIHAITKELSNVLFDFTRFSISGAYREDSTEFLEHARVAEDIKDPNTLLNTCYKMIERLDKKPRKLANRNQDYENAAQAAIDRISNIRDRINSIIA